MSRTASRRVAWGLFDQVLASASNFVVIVLAARGLSASGFGSFALALEIYLGTLLVVRGLASDPLAAAHAGEDAGSLRGAIRSAGSAAVAAAVGLSVLTAAVGVLVGGTLGTTFLVLAALLPGLALQDFVRYALIVQGRPRATFLNDLLWFVLQVPLLVLASQVGGAPILLLAWGVIGNVAAVVGLAQVRTAVSGPRAAPGWLRRHRNLWPWFLVDNVVFQATSLVLAVVITATASLAEVGGFRAAMTVYAPLSIIGRGLIGVVVPELARWRDDPSRVQRIALTIAWVLTPMALVWAFLALLVPAPLGRAFFGDSWAEAEPLVFLLGAVSAVSLFAAGAGVGLRALGAGREGLTARIAVSVFGLACAAVGGVIDGAYGVVLVLAITAPLQIGVWWRLLVVAARNRRPPENLRPGRARGAPGTTRSSA